MSSTAMKTAPSLPALGANLRTLRQKQGLSLDVLARRSGVSKAMLSQIEQGKTNPTVATVWKISVALGISLHEMLDAGSGRAVEILRGSDAMVVAEKKGNYEVRVVSPVHMVEDVEMYVVNFSARGELKSKAHYAGTTELVNVVRGSFRITSGKDTEVINQGDSARYAADQEHSIVLLGKTPGTIIMVVKFAK